MVYICVSSAGHHHPPTSTGIMLAEKTQQKFGVNFRIEGKVEIPLSRFDAHRKKIRDQFFHCASSRILDIDKLQQNMVICLGPYSIYLSIN